MRRIALAFTTFFLCNGAFALTAVEAQADGSGVGASLTNSTANNLGSGNAQQMVPGYTEGSASNMTSNFGGTSLTALGVARNGQCDQAGYVKNGSSTNQECNASVTIRQSTNVSTLRPDQIPTPSTTVSISSALGATTNSKVCRTPGQVGSPVDDYQTCNEALVPYDSLCNRVMNPLCAFLGSPIRNGINPSNQFGPIGFSASPTDTSGLYNYSIWGGGHRTEAGITISYELDSVSKGSYMTINLSNLDDSMAIGVNNTTVFAGRPNSECNGGGPPNFFAFQDSREYGSFQPGYSECWTAYREECTNWSYDWDGNSYCSQTEQMPYQQCVGGIKVADRCVRGSGGALTCTPSGKMVYYPTEGCGTYGGAIPSATIPLVVGKNYITVWWGNVSGWGDPYGQFNITGQIYNVGMVCTAPWTENCNSQKAAQ